MSHSVMTRTLLRMSIVLAWWGAGGCVPPATSDDFGESATLSGKTDAGGRTWSSERQLDVEGLPLSRAGLAALCAKGPSRHTERVMCHLVQAGKFGTFAGAPGNQGEPSIRINYAFFPASGTERAAIVVVTGRTETYAKYAELIYDLTVVNRDLGYSLYLIDHRGQGFSERLLKHDPALDHDRGFVQSFDDYVADLKRFVDQVVRPSSHPAVLGLAHSLGGGIMTRYLQKHAGDGAFDGVILTSPMHGIADVDGEATGPLGWAKEQASLVFLRSLVSTGQGWRYVPGGGPFDPSWGFFDDPEVGNSVTHSLDRHAFVKAIYRTFPETQLGSATARWVVESHDATVRMQERAQSAHVNLPVLVLQAAEEQIVSNPKQRVVCDHLPRCRLEVVPGSRHEPIIERDSVRNAYMNRIVAFFEAQLD
jgi:lysophospholipase